MGHALRAFGLNLKHCGEDHTVTTAIVLSTLMALLVFLAVTLVHGCENEAVGGCGVDRATHPRCELTGGFSDSPSAKEAAGDDAWGRGDATSSDQDNSDQSPISFASGLKPQACFSAVAASLVAGPMEAPAGKPSVVPPIGGPGGRRFWRATIHHTATPPDRPAERVRNIDADHRARGWGGCGYHFLVAEDGTVFSGRPLDRQGVHVRGQNGGNLGIAFIGAYTDRPPPEAALAAVRRILAQAGLGPDAVYFHKDLAATECPGTWDKGVLF